MMRCPNVGLLLARLLRHRPIIQPALDQHLMVTAINPLTAGVAYIRFFHLIITTFSTAF